MIAMNSENKFNILSAFFLQLWCYYHKKSDSFDFSFWSDQMDKAGISWSIQNSIAIAAETVENQHIYFRTLLKRLNIQL